VRKPACGTVEEKQRVVLAVLAGELTAAEAARRHGVSTNAVLSGGRRFSTPVGGRWRRRSPARTAGPETPEERRLRVEATS